MVFDFGTCERIEIETVSKLCEILEVYGSTGAESKLDLLDFEIETGAEIAVASVDVKEAASEVSEAVVSKTIVSAEVDGVLFTDSGGVLRSAEGCCRSDYCDSRKKTFS